MPSRARRGTSGPAKVHVTNCRCRIRYPGKRFPNHPDFGTLAPHLLLLVLEVELLRSKDGPWARHPEPRDTLSRREHIVLHHVERNQGTRPSEPRLAVDRDASPGRLGNPQELLHNWLWWDRAVHEKEVVMHKPSVRKAGLLVQRVVQPNNVRHPPFRKVVEVVLRSKQWVPVVPLVLVVRPSKRNELAWKHPVQVSVLDALVILVFLHVERAEVEPPVKHALHQTIQALNDWQAVRARRVV
mmetsp:Transcript_23141/g.60473  ORF Transcript_23141/g.60473 Transcript_23141/m.60473 type:complete len:242 (-) Transcript_23141:729-1454(-)